LMSAFRDRLLQTRALLVGAAFLLCAGCGPRADQTDQSVKAAPADKRFATPKDSARTLFQAMNDGNIALVKECILQEPGQAEIAEGFTEMTVAMRKATEAAKKRFGQDFREAAGGPFGSMSVATDEIDNAIERIRGDGASLKIEEKQMDLQLMRIDGAWKTDLIASFSSDLDLRSPENRQMTRNVFNAMARGADKTTTEITSGKYKNALDAVQGLARNMQSAIGEEQNRLTKPKSG
jgi:hypothetical protein